MVADFVDRLAISVAIRRFPCMGSADSRSLRSDNHVRMQHFVRRTAIPFRRFWGDVRREFMECLSVALHGTLGSYPRDPLQEGNADVVACLHVPWVEVFSSFLLFAWWLMLLFLVNIFLYF
jgi:hypothetical protein